MTRHSFLRLLVEGAALSRYDDVLRAAIADASTEAEVDAVQDEHTYALQLREQLEQQRARHEQLRALVECAKELGDVRTDRDTILSRIVAQAQRLLGSDMAYLSLNDNERRQTHMRVMVGATSSAWKGVPIPFGTGVGGKVAATGAPFSTPDYFADDRLLHDPVVDNSVRTERQVSIVGVPLMRHNTVIGVLFAANRVAGPFSHDSIALLGSFAALAAIAIDQAQLVSDKERALAELHQANEDLRRRTIDTERAVAAHDRSMEIVLRGGGVQEIVTAAGEQLGGELAIIDDTDTAIAWTPGTSKHVLRSMHAVASSNLGRSGRSVHAGNYWITSLSAGTEKLGALVWAPPSPPDQVGDADQRLLEGAAVVASLLQLFNHNLGAAEARVRGELLDDLLSPTPHTYSSLVERAQRVGYLPGKPHAVVVAQILAESRQRLASAAAEQAVSRDGLSTVRDGLAVLVVPSDDPALTGQQICRSMTQRLGAPVTVGACGPVDDPVDLPAAHAEAAACVRALLRLGRVGDSATTGDLGYAGLLLGDSTAAHQFVTKTLGPVIQHDQQRSTALLATVETYFATGQSLAASAKHLHVHPNTITQRLDRIKRLIGANWNSPDHALEVQLALRLHRLLGDDDPRP